MYLELRRQETIISATNTQNITLQNSSLSSSDIIYKCHHPDQEIIGELLHENLVIKLLEELVIKLGHGVSVEEADNQRTASSNEVIYGDQASSSAPRDSHLPKR